MTDPTLYQLDEAFQRLGERLDEQQGSVRALSALVNNWISEIRHADARLLTGMASLIRIQGWEIARIADELDALLREMQQQDGGAR